MATNSDNFKDFSKDLIKNPTKIIMIVSFVLFIIFYITLKAADINNKSGIMALKVLSLISMIIFIISLAKTFMPSFDPNKPTIFQRILFFLITSWEYIKIFFSNIFNFLKNFFVNLIYSIKDLFLSIFFPNLYILAGGIVFIGLLLMLGFGLYYLGIYEKIGKIKQHVEAKKIIYSVFIFIILLLGLSFVIPQLYSSDISPSYKAASLVAIIALIAMLLAGFFINEIFKGNYRNYGMLLFNILIFSLFIYLIYGIKKFFFDPKSPTLENYSVFEYFLYYYLFPIIFVAGYILYYIFVYRKENLKFTDFSDYRVIIFDVLSGIIMLYLIYQLIIKHLLSASTDSSIIHFIQSIFKIIPCIFTVLFEYLIKNPLVGILSIGLSVIFILMMMFISSKDAVYDSWYMILLYIIGSIATIAGILKILLTVTNLGESKVFKLLQKTIFTLPCLFLLGLDKAFGGQKFGTASEFLFIVLLIFFIFFYNAITTAIVPDLYERYILSDGKQVINNPLALTKNTFISSYEDLFNFENTQSDDVNNINPNKFDYKYGLSFWIYLDSFTPPNSQLYDICSLGDGLMVKYNPVENTLYFMYKKGKNTEVEVTKDEKENFSNLIQNIYENDDVNNFEENKKPLTIEELNKWQSMKKRKQLLKKFLEQNNRLKTEGFENNSDDVIIYKQKDVLLQRWNNIIINYYGGTLDIFINGEMVASKINVAPYIINTALTVGMDNGINGDICNLIYYKSPMNKSDIYRMYHIFKNKNPPIINKADTNILNLSETLNVYVSELISKNDKK